MTIYPILCSVLKITRASRDPRDLPAAKLVELVPLGLAVADHDDLVLAGHLELMKGPVLVRVDT